MCHCACHLTHFEGPGWDAIRKFKAVGVEGEQASPNPKGGTDKAAIRAKAEFLDEASPNIWFFAVVEKTRPVFMNFVQVRRIRLMPEHTSSVRFC